MHGDRERWVRRVGELLGLFHDDGARARAAGVAVSPARRRGRPQATVEARKRGWLLDSLVENAPVMIFLKNAVDLTVELWNKRAEEISGVPAADILGKTGFESFPLDEMTAFQERDRSVLDGKRLIAIEETLTGPSGEPRWIFTRKIPLCDEQGRPRYLLGISEDVTERRRSTEELRRAKDAAEAANRAKSEFLANVSHELRTPLSLILGPVEDALADTEEPLPPRQRERLAMVRRNTLRLTKLVGALLDFARVEAGRAEASLAPHDLAALTADLVSSFRSAIEGAGLALEIAVEPTGLVQIDAEMWEKIVFNLLSNALKFTFTGSIRVSLKPAGEDVVLEVRDTGTGIPEDEIPRVFDRFHRVPGARSRTQEGTGIGLSLVRELVHLHGGTIHAESEAGRGTALTVIIPRGAARLPAAPAWMPPRPAGAAARTAPFVEEAKRCVSTPVPPESPVAEPRVGDDPVPRILVVDDNADMRAYLVGLLGRSWTVRAVSDGAAALEDATRAPPDLILTDLMMSEMSGMELVRALRADARTSAAPIIMLTARAGEDAAIEGREAGADDYLVKPFSARELLARVRTTLALARLRRDLEEKQRARAAAEAANRVKDEFLATVSHELRTPLTAIMGWTSLLGAMPPSAEGLARGLGVIKRNGEALQALVEDILDVSRIVTGNMRTSLQPVDFAAVVGDAIDRVTPGAVAKGVILLRRGAEGPCRVHGDPQRLGQVVGNLLGNAIKFTPAGGRVTVSLSLSAGNAILAVEDSGEGIDAAFLPHVFDRFRQADSSTARRYGGLGLGLSIVQHIVAMHGGEVRAESPGKGMGATFTVTLPCDAQATADAAQGRAPGGEEGGDVAAVPRGGLPTGARMP